MGIGYMFHSQLFDDSKDQALYFQSNAFLHKIITIFYRIYTSNHSFCSFVLF